MSENSLQNLVDYRDLMEEYDTRSEEIIPSRWSQHQAVLTVLLVVICTYQLTRSKCTTRPLRHYVERRCFPMFILTAAFASLSLTFLNRKTSAVKYFVSAAVASISVALSAVYVCNFFGVYI